MPQGKVRLFVSFDPSQMSLAISTRKARGLHMEKPLLMFSSVGNLGSLNARVMHSIIASELIVTRRRRSEKSLDSSGTYRVKIPICLRIWKTEGGLTSY